MKIAHAIRNVLGFIGVTAGTATILASMVDAISPLEIVGASIVTVIFVAFASIFDHIGK